MINASSNGRYLLSAAAQALNPASCKPTSSSICSALANSAGAAGIPKEAASAICTLSTEGLALLGDAAETGFQAVADVVEDTGEWIGNSLDQAAKEAVSLYGDIASLAEEGADAVSDAAAAVADSISSAKGSLTSYGAMAVAAGGALLREVI